MVMYKEMIEQIEYGTELARFALVNLTGPATILPALLVTLVNYFIYGFGDDSFFLPCPVMYDNNRMTRGIKCKFIDQKFLFVLKGFRSIPKHQSATHSNWLHNRYQHLVQFTV